MRNDNAAVINLFISGMKDSNNSISILGNVSDLIRLSCRRTMGLYVTGGTGAIHSNDMDKVTGSLKARHILRVGPTMDP